MTIGQKIKTIRKKVGMTQQDLSLKTGISVQSIRRYESGKIVPKSQNLLAISNALGVSPSDLDAGLKESIERWNHECDSETLSKEVSVWESIIETFGEEPASFFNDFLSLNPEGQEKASEYMEFLMQKHRK